MIRIVAVLTLIGILFCVPMNAKAQDPIGAMIWELGLNQGQIDEIRSVFQYFQTRQQAIPTPGNILMQNQGTLREVLTTVPFDRAKAQQLAQRATSVVEQRMINRLELRNRIFQILTPPQQQKYLGMVGEFFADLQ